MAEETGTIRALGENLEDEVGMIQGITRGEGIPVEETITTEEGVRVNRGFPANQDGDHTVPEEGEDPVGKVGARGVSPAPEHSSSRVFCESHDGECRDDMAGCHRSQ
mgnify:FL=1|tara:strand:+ start:3518 stop:3838 length:321 start_codon:yes stop_codon:yes gene_type:complete